MQIGLGTAALGRPQYINLRQERVKFQHLEAFKKNSYAVLEKAYQLGIRYFDTAPGYGLAEQLLLDWLETKNDDSIRVATKWGYTYVADFNANAKVHEVKEHSIQKLKEQWGVSKALLNYLKVYQIHSATMNTGVLQNKAILERLAVLKTEHDLKIGITTTGVNQVEVIKKALDVSIDGKPLFDAFQVTYNILDQSLKTISDILTEDGKSIIIKEALANGRFFRNRKYTHYKEMYNFLEILAIKYKVGVDAIVLNFCKRSIPKSMVLSGASSSLHLKENLKTNGFNLSEEEVHHLSTFKIKEAEYWQERSRLAWN